MFLPDVASRLRLVVRGAAALLRRRGSHLTALVVASMVLLAYSEDRGPDADFGSSRGSIAVMSSTQPAEDAGPNDESGLRSRSLRVVVAHWAAITDQRRDVLDLQRSDVVRILTGRVRNWSALGGSPVPITGYLPRSQFGLIVNAFGLSTAELAVEVVPDDQIMELVEHTPGAFALVRPQRLRLGVLALTVNGHDPYRDPGVESPLRLVRWIRPPRSADQLPRFFRDFRRIASPFDPVGLLITGELIPVRCTNHVLEALGDYDAMFDGVRDAIVAADLAVAPLELPLTANKELTPCVETVIFTGSHKAVPAMANAGLDVVLTIGNHMMDCWKGCSGVAALYETLARLRNAGIVTAGAGSNLQAARTPALVNVPTRQGPVRFAFLGYDIIAPWYHAKVDQPGTAPLVAEYVRRDVRLARKIADHVLVGVNWGVEYSANPIADQRRLAGVAMEAGATFLFGNHPHWVQAVEHFNDQLVAYSFGNFIFDQNWSVPTTQGMLMELGFIRERLLGYRIRPVVIRAHSSALPWLYRPEFVDPAVEGRPIMDRIWRATDRLPTRPAEAATIPEN